MYEIVTIEDEISVPPEMFGSNLTESIKSSVVEKFEGKVNCDIGVILAVKEIESVGEGRILPGDPSVHYPVKFKLLTWMPKDHEIIEGEVMDIAEFGAFINVGALDGLVHVSQIMDDYVSYDEKNSQLAGKQTKRVLKQGDKVRARIVSISFKEQSKVGLTMRQPFLGATHWLDGKPKGKEEKKKEPKKRKK